MRDVIYLGADPGKYGALCAIYPDGEIEYESTPLVLPLSKNSVVDAIRVGEFVDQLSHMDIVFVIENVHSMPGQGVSSTFKFGHTTGIVTGAVVARASSNGSLLSQHKVSPQKWKKHFGLIGKEKDAAIELMKSYVNVDFTGINKQHLSGIADSYLIARYGKETLL